MNLDMNHLFLSLMVSLIGSAYLMYGKRQMEMRFVAAGVGLMFFSYFVPSLLVTALVATLIAASPFFVR